ncbi:MAG: HAMP domain-containing protein [Phycisphaerales bacterium]|nr:MAG: HAMP domain-containing protein [Phycisphaerales bacterium]
MTLRNRLLLLLGTFAGFAVLAAATTIYAIQWHVEGALRNFEETLGQTAQIYRLHVVLTEQALHLHDVIDGNRDAIRPYLEARDEFSTKVRQAASFAPDLAHAPHWGLILQLADSLEEESDNCLALIETGKDSEAKSLLVERLEGELFPELGSRLLAAKAALDESRSLSTRQVVATSKQILGLTISVGCLAAGLVIFGSMLIRRWLFVPIEDLQEAAKRFSEGKLSFRTSPRSHDELGKLGAALNEMAQSVADAQAETQASEEKHRSLFANLRDAVVICDIDGKIIEYHDGETARLGVEPREHEGRQLLEVWPEWRSVPLEWLTVIRAAITDGRRFRAVDVEFSGAARGEVGAFADLLVYRIRYGTARYAAIILRDVTERQRLQIKLRRAETMEAVGTMAGGLAHDFNNLLANVMGTLSSIASDFADSRYAERIQSALRSCRHAAGLSKRLLSFASSAHGDAHVFCIAEMVDLIIDSLEPSFFEGVDVRKELDYSVHTRMDPDQFTQAAMNLLRNARDAMPHRGSLFISVESTTARNPDEASDERPYALLVVQDTGDGMTPDVQRRVFEPFFTTKSRAERRGRGLGLAVVYSAVNNAGGFVRVQSQPSEGTAFRVYLPLGTAPVDLPSPKGEPPGVTGNQG